MGTEPAESSPSREFNYFNYFTEIEEHFQRTRGTGLFLMSPLDWALIEAWKNAGVPLEAIVRGIDAAFEKWRAKPRKHMVNSLAYCTQAVMTEAQLLADSGAVRPQREIEAPFTLEELRAHLERAIGKLQDRPGFSTVAEALERIRDSAEVHYTNLEELEQRLTALEEKLAAIVRSSLDEEALFELRRDLDATLRPYRAKMPAGQIAMLERQYLERAVLEKARLPRLSLFYMA